mmetsp:Transcript_9808/g.13675  ORF Transcript_9808/g.13675 Transcript_9808/m.13675 type:complete len:98 (-) Transcript_9808:755-1048(-)
MVKKRRNNGRSKHNRGHVGRIQCIESNTMVPRDKAIKVLQNKLLKEVSSKKDISNALVLPGYKIPQLNSFVFYCISSAFSKKIVKSRPKTLRRKKTI